MKWAVLVYPVAQPEVSSSSQSSSSSALTESQDTSSNVAVQSGTRVRLIPEWPDIRVFQDADSVEDDDDMNFYSMNEGVYGYEDDMFEN